MKPLFFIILSISLLLLIGDNLSSFGQTKKSRTSPIYQNGDIIFQSSNSRQCEAVKLATHSNISHCGILFQEKNAWYVLEAVELVQIIPLKKFIARGTDNHYTIKRLKSNFFIENETFNQMIKKGKEFIGRHYDLFFNWSDKEIYCSELVWKLYKQQANIELCSLKPLKSYDLKDNFVGVMMKERYGNDVPLDELMVAPSDIAASDKLIIIEEK